MGEMGENSGYKDFVAGMLAGVATVAVGHPFDTVKVNLQKYNSEPHGKKYKSGLHCAARIVKTEGVQGLYRGATSSFVGMAFESSLAFGLYSQMKQLLQGEIHSEKPQPYAIAPAGAFAGALISFILCPSELVKCRMQVQGTDPLLPISSRYNGPVDCALKTIKTEGPTGIFRGGIATLCRESLGNAVFFTTYEYVRYHMNLRLRDACVRYQMHLRLRDASCDLSQLIDVGVGIVSGGLGGMACWSVVLPLDVAKTIVQTSPDERSTRNPFRILESIYRRSGVRGCYTGLGPTLIRAFPANAAAIVTWELSMKMLGIQHE